MGLITIEITQELTFNLGNNRDWLYDDWYDVRYDAAWGVGDFDPVEQVHEKECYYYIWCLEIDPRDQTILCEVWHFAFDDDGCCVVDECECQYTRTFPLRPGTVVLTNLHDQCDTSNDSGKNHQPFMRASFRPSALQELMDRYGIVAIRRLDPNRNYYRDGGEMDDAYEWYTDGQTQELVNDDRTLIGWTISNASWAIARVWLADRNNYAYVLYAKQRISAAMEESFLLHGMQPTERNDDRDL